MSIIRAPEQPQQTIIVQRAGSPGCLIQGLWFMFIGWWLGALAIPLAWIIGLTIIGLPLALLIVNNIPMLLALQSQQRTVRAVSNEGTTIVIDSELPQFNFVLRALFFLFIGWWWSFVWLVLAYFLCVTLILMPVGLGMFRLTPLMTTLKRY